MLDDIALVRYLCGFGWGLRIVDQSFGPTLLWEGVDMDLRET